MKEIKKVCYIEAGLWSDSGHFATCCRAIVGELAKRSIKVDVYSNSGISPELALELNATPSFRRNPYSPETRRNLDFFLAFGAFYLDLRKIPVAGHYDLVFFGSLLAPQLLSVALWLRSMARETRPYTAIEFCVPSNNSRRFVPGGRLLVSDAPSPFLFTFEDALSTDYSRLLGRHVHSMPNVYSGAGQTRRRAKDESGTICISFLGYQRYEKGYQMIPAIIEKVLALSLPVRALVHNSNNETSYTPISDQLRSLANQGLICFEQGTGGQHYWQKLLDRADLIVLPYAPSSYAVRFSGIVSEAISEGIPLLVPADTALSSQVAQYQNQALGFKSWDADSIAESIQQAVTKFDTLADSAQKGAQVWRQTNNATMFVDRLLSAWAPND